MKHHWKTICGSTLLLLLPFCQLFSQADPKKIVPPSPNAATLGKYGDIPVGHYTGTVSVSVPLYEIKYGDFTLPIGLNYHSQGLKVEEKAGWIGMNWVLNAGGVITRAMKGRADEDNGYWTHASWTDAYIASNSAITESVCKGEFDLQPDIFYFNFLGNNGKFVLDATAPHTGHPIPFQNLKIIPNSTLTSIEIIDANGVRFQFSDVETTIDDNTPPDISYYKSAWYLTKIILISGEEINFTYKNEKTYSHQISESHHLITSPGPDAPTFSPGHQLRTLYFEIDSKILSQISTPLETVKFASVKDRQDMVDAYRLTSMTVEDKALVTKKKFAFTQSYFGNTGSSSPDAKRLKLDEVVEWTPDNSLSKTHALEYYSPEQVPATTSMSQDFWGYFNGKSNTSMLPYMDPATYGYGIADQAAIYYGDRSPVFAKSVVGVLKKITYPTGGSSEFIYESNDYGYIGATANNDQEHISAQVVPLAKINSTTNIPTDTKTFTIGETQIVAISRTGSYNNPPPVEDGPSIILNRINTNGTRTNIFTRTMMNTSENITQNLTAGNYEIIARVDGNNQTATATLKYYSVGSVIKTILTGGVRIKQVNHLDGITAVQTSKQYSYVTKNDAARSSGVLVSDIITTEVQQSYAYAYYYLVRHTTATNYLGYTQGSHLGYSFVTEQSVGPENVGKTEYTYTTSANYGNVVGTYNRIPNQNVITPISNPVTGKYLSDYDFCRGFLTKRTDYNSLGQVVVQKDIAYNLPTALNSSAPNYLELKARYGVSHHLCHIGCPLCECPDPDNCYDCNTYE